MPSDTENPPTTVGEAEDKFLLPLDDDSQKSFWARHQNFIKVVPFLVTPTLAVSFLTPLTTSIMTEYFGSADKAAQVQGATDAAACFFSAFLMPLVGRISDKYGRRPFILLYAALWILQPLSLLLSPHNPWPFLAARSIVFFAQGGQTASMIVSLFTADLYLPKHRSMAFGISLGSLSSGLLLSPVAAKVPGSTAIYSIVVGVFSAAFILLAVTLPESLPRALRSPTVDLAGIQNPFAPLLRLFDSTLITCLGFVVLLTVLPDTGLFDVLVFYLKGELEASKDQIRWAIFAFGLALVFAMGPVLYLMLKVLRHDDRVLALSLFFSVAYMVLYMFIDEMWQAYAIAPLMGISMICFPLCMSVASKIFAADEQGKRLAVLGSMRSLGVSLGPFGLSQIYHTFSKSSLHYPAAPFAFGAFLMLLALLTTLFGIAPILSRQRQLASKSGLINEDDEESTRSHLEDICDRASTTLSHLSPRPTPLTSPLDTTGGARFSACSSPVPK